MITIKKYFQINKPARYCWPDEELARALKPLSQKVTVRYWIETLRLVLLWGLAVTGALLALLWLYPVMPLWTAVILGNVVVVAILMIRIYQRPDALDVVHVADQLGLNGAAVTSFRVLETSASDSWSRTAASKGIAACNNQSVQLAALYPPVSSWCPWRDVAFLAGLIVILNVVPNPLLPYWAEKQARQEALDLAALEARQTVERVKDLQVNGEQVLPDEVKRKLAGLPKDIKNSSNERAAADKLERARWDIEEAGKFIDPYARQDLKQLADLWGNMPEVEWQKTAAALEKGDAVEIEKALKQLSSKMQEAGSEQRESAAAALFNGVAAVNSPDLSRALREAAGAMLDSGNQAAGTPGAGNSGQNGQSLAAATSALSGALSGMAQSASAGSALGNASATMAALAQSLAGGAAGGATAVAASGTGNGSTDAGSASGGAASGAGAADGGGQGSGGDSNDGNGNSGGTGNGNGNNSGNGTGGNGSGGTGAGKSGGGLDLIYTPFLPNSQGTSSQVTGQMRQGEQGSEVQLERSPTALGALRPYTEVYGQYMAEAHESISRAPLPPDMEKLVWQYFTSLNENNEQ